MADEKGIELLEHGVVLYRGAFSEAEQMQLLQTSFEVNDPYKITPNKKMYTPLFAWKWPTNKFQSWRDLEKEETKPHLFDSFLSRCREVHTAMMAVVQKSQRPKPDNPRLHFPEKFGPSSLRGILYPHDGQLHPHQDMFMGWVMSLSIGKSCDFFFGTHWEPDDEHTHFVSIVAGQLCVGVQLKEFCYAQVRLDSGDAILLNGQVLHHGVSKLYDETPPFWQTATDNMIVPGTWARFNMQVRDCKSILL